MTHRRPGEGGVRYSRLLWLSGARPSREKNTRPFVSSSPTPEIEIDTQWVNIHCTHPPSALGTTNGGIFTDGCVAKTRCNILRVGFKFLERAWDASTPFVPAFFIYFPASKRARVGFHIIFLIFNFLHAMHPSGFMPLRLSHRGCSTAVHLLVPLSPSGVYPPLPPSPYVRHVIKSRSHFPI